MRIYCGEKYLRTRTDLATQNHRGRDTNPGNRRSPVQGFEQEWEIGQYLDFVCQKAGLSSTAWKDLKTEILSFEGIIFSEISPKGRIINRTI